MATRKITVTIPEDLLEEIRGEVAERGLSAYVAEALRMKHEQDQLAEVAAWLEEEYGPVTEEELAAARAELDAISAEYARLASPEAEGSEGSGERAA